MEGNEGRQLGKPVATGCIHADVCSMCKQRHSDDSCCCLCVPLPDSVHMFGRHNGADVLPPPTAGATPAQFPAAALRECRGRGGGLQSSWGVA
jgi:hypothetical protein